MSKEGITQSGFGVSYNKNVSVRTGDKVSGHGDQQFSDVKAAYNKAQNDTKKA